jgi:hypothetical protein
VAGVKPFRLHDLRHFYARHVLRRGIDISLVQRQLCHSSVKTTAIYLEAEEEERRRTHLLRSPGDGLDDLSTPPPRPVRAWPPPLPFRTDHRDGGNGSSVATNNRQRSYTAVP